MELLMKITKLPAEEQNEKEGKSKYKTCRVPENKFRLGLETCRESH